MTCENKYAEAETETDKTTVTHTHFVVQTPHLVISSSVRRRVKQQKEKGMSML